MNLILPQCPFNMPPYHSPNHHCLKGRGMDLFYSLHTILRKTLHLYMYSKHTCATAYYVHKEGIDFGDHFYNVPTEDLELNSKIIPQFPIYKILH